MKKIKVKVQNKTTLVLEEPGAIGDTIDLSELVTIDQNPIIEAIKRGTDDVYARYFSEQKRSIDIQHSAELSKARQEVINQARAESDNLKEQLGLIIQKQREELSAIKATQQEKIETEKQRITNQKQQELFDKQQRIATLEHRIVSLEEKMQLEIENERKTQLLLLNKKENELHSQIEKLKTENEQLTRERNTRNVKKIGENLEKWCLEKYLEINAFAFNTSTFEKDNEAIKDEPEGKGTKGDYIFKVFADSNHEQLLTSAMCEMKSEALESDNKKRNSDHYAKLDRDRNKKGLEYAILISELEYNQESDAPLFRVSGYEKMYVVRPTYFITLLGIIESIGMKYADLLNARQLEKISFKESEEILTDFEAFKDSIIDNQLRHIATKLDEIHAQARTIQGASQKIIDAVEVVVKSHLEAVRNKIDNFSIKSLAKRIKRIG